MTRSDQAAFDHPALGSRTVPEAVVAAVDRHPTAVAQSYKGGVYDRSLVDSGAIPAAPDGGYADLSYGELQSLVDHLAAGFRRLGITSGDRLTLVSETRMEWTQVDLAIQTAGGVVSTVYPELTDGRFEFLLSDTQPTGVVVENAELLAQLLALEDVPDLEFVVVIDSLADGSGMAAAVRDRNDILTLGAVYDRGVTDFDAAAVDAWRSSIEPPDLATIVYTSGTTGQPKGVRLTHRNLTANVDQTFRRFGPCPDRDDVPHLDHTTRHLSVLPLAHIFERLVGSYLMLAAGATIAYAESTETLAVDFQLVEPTTLTAVPRLYERLYERFEQQASSSVVGRRLFEWATSVAARYHETATPSCWLRLAHAVADRLVFREIRAGLGGNLELCISGGDSLSAELCAMFHGMGVPVFEGYGLTEAAPVVSANPPDAPQSGTIGPPLSGLDIQLDETVDGETTPGSNGTVGELLVCGPNVSAGYWNCPEATDRTFVIADDDAVDGTRRWLRTGDIVERRPSGYLVFCERRTELLVLSTGKNVAPTPLEDAIETGPLIAQCVVVGDSRPYVTALVVPAFDAVRAWAEREKLALPAEPARVVDDDRLQSRIQHAVETHTESFEPHERVGDIRLVAEEFRVDNELLTPTMKPRRAAIAERYADEIDALYETN